jgi:hypothetical protein
MLPMKQTAMHCSGVPSTPSSFDDVCPAQGMNDKKHQFKDIHNQVFIDKKGGDYSVLSHWLTVSIMKKNQPHLVNHDGSGWSDDHAL